MLQELEETLRGKGVGIDADTDADANVPIILVADHVDDAVVRRVRLLSDDGSRNLLVVLATTQVADEALRALAAGAADVVMWSGSATADSVDARLTRWQEVQTLAGAHHVANTLVGRSAAWLAVLRDIVEIATYTSANVLVTGETGTGKELVARLVHQLDRRSEKGRFVVLDCTTVVPTLSGSEFFGHEKGAFTGADTPRDGAFALANGGTLFLDEVGELPLPLQAELLRVVQEGTYKRVGGNRWRRTNFRLVCATNRELLARCERGEFRQDFYYRIAEWLCHLPPLRERSEDVLPLARHFLADAGADPDPPAIDPLVARYLMERDYPGNARELRQLMSRIRHRHVGSGPVTIGDVPPDERQSWLERDAPSTAIFDEAARHALRHGASLKTIQAEATDAAIGVALADADGRVAIAADRLGVTPRALQKRLAARRADDEVADGSDRREPGARAPGGEHPVKPGGAGPASR